MIAYILLPEGKLMQVHPTLLQEWKQQQSVPKDHKVNDHDIDELLTNKYKWNNRNNTFR